VSGYDVLKMYQMHRGERGSYLRLTRALKQPYMLAMQSLCKELGLGFYVSDADFKELSATGCCCGLDESWNWSRGQFSEALQIAKKQGVVKWPDIAKHLDWATGLFVQGACGNSISSERRAGFCHFTQRDFLRWYWDNPRSIKGPYKYFGGVLVPVARDENSDLVYEYRGESEGVCPIQRAG